MANSLLRILRRPCLVSLLSSSSHISLPLCPNIPNPGSVFLISSLRPALSVNPSKSWSDWRSYSHGTVNFVITPDGKPKFETHEIEPPKKEKWKTKKRLKLQRKREKMKRKAANKRDPRRLNVKGKRQKFGNAAERIKDKLERAKIKEARLVERLKRYEVPKVQAPTIKLDELTGEERFYMKKMAQKRSNYVPVGRRGVFGGVILNMHMHWKNHETVKVYCKPCKPGQVQEYADEIARLSGGIPIQIIGNDTIIFYRGKNYIQPEIMSPIDTLSKKRALEKSKYEQSLESVRRFIAIAEKELELYYRHVALYGDPNDRNPLSMFNNTRYREEKEELGKEKVVFPVVDKSHVISSTKANLSDYKLIQSDEESDDQKQHVSESEEEADDDAARFSIDNKKFDSCDDEADYEYPSFKGNVTAYSDSGLLANRRYSK